MNHNLLFSPHRVRAEGCLVVIYSSFTHRDFRTLGAVVGPRTILTCGHTTWKSDPGDGELERVIVVSYPLRMSRGEVIGRWPGREGQVNVSTRSVAEGLSAIRFLADPVKPERSARFWENSIARLGPKHGDLGKPAYLLSERGLIPWPCETRGGFSGAPVFNKDLDLIGVHWGRVNFAAGSKTKSSLNSAPVWIPLPEGRPWITPSNASHPASAAKAQAP